MQNGVACLLKELILEQQEKEEQSPALSQTSHILCLHLCAPSPNDLDSSCPPSLVWNIYLKKKNLIILDFVSIQLLLI